jgi:hypothetical protein
MTESRPAANVLVAGFVIFGGVLAGILLVYTVLNSRGNDLSEFAKYLALIGFVAGFVNPRTMLFPFILATGYLDLLKRLLILYDRPTYEDLFYVLGISPLLLAGITLGTLVGAWFGKIKVDRRHVGLLGLAALFVCLTAAFAFRDHGPREAVKAIADNAAYSVLLFVIPVLFPTWQEFWRLIRFTLIAYIPVGIYTYYQHLYGLSAFEIEYLKSGLTIMVKELADIRPRPFSTLNSAHSLAFVSAIMAVLSFIPLVAGRGDPVSGRHRWLFASLGVFYITVCILTMARSGNLVWLVAFAAIVTFTSKRRTVAVYGAALTLYLSLIIFSEWFIMKLPVWDAYLMKGTPLITQATRIQTFTDRLRSYSELKNPENYTLFGVSHDVFAHDAITEALVNFGAVPLVMILVTGIFCLYRIHQWVFRLPPGGYRRLACLFLGSGLGIVAGAVLFGGVAGVFPVNAFMWIAFGGLVMLIFNQMDFERARTRVQSVPNSPQLTTNQPCPVPSRA